MTSHSPEHPYSAARVAGGLVFVSGALSVDQDYQPVPGGYASCEAAVERLAERLAEVGARLEDVIKTTYFVTDIGLREAANAHYCAAFRNPRPARTFVEVTALPYGACVEIDAVATALGPDVVAAPVTVAAVKETPA